MFAHGVEGEAPAEPRPGLQMRLGGSLALQWYTTRKHE